MLKSSNYVNFFYLKGCNLSKLVKSVGEKEKERDYSNLFLVIQYGSYRNILRLCCPSREKAHSIAELYGEDFICGPLTCADVR